MYCSHLVQGISGMYLLISLCDMCDSMTGVCKVDQGWYSYFGPKFFPKKSQPNFQCAVACCDMLQNPHQQAPKSGAAAWCSMLQQLVLAGETGSNQMAMWLK